MKINTSNTFSSEQFQYLPFMNGALSLNHLSAFHSLTDTPPHDSYSLTAFCSTGLAVPLQNAIKTEFQFRSKANLRYSLQTSKRGETCKITNSSKSCNKNICQKKNSCPEGEAHSNLHRSCCTDGSLLALWIFRLWSQVLLS